MKEVLSKLIELLKIIIERYPAHWAIKVIMAISVFVILPMFGMTSYFRDSFSSVLTLLIFCALILLDLKVEKDTFTLILKLRGESSGESTK